IVFREAVRRYWPGVEDRTLSPDYSGIRPKIAGDDFVIRRDGPIINLLGIESPGLTSSLAIGEIVANLAVNTD
ncbi:MAG: FAD-dependent oxidoreductase, partial [Alphaproteobacteria bacterium]